MAKNIKNQGWRAPITVSTRSGFIVRGHGRLLAAQFAGLSQVSVDRQVIHFAPTSSSTKPTGIYHIIIRGINKQVIFEDEEDRERFLWCLRYYKELSRYEIYGYSLMNNHVLLHVMQSPSQPFEQSRQICGQLQKERILVLG